MTNKAEQTLERILKRLRERKTLNGAQMSDWMQALMSGKLTDDIIEDFLIILRERGETSEEVASAALVMRKHALTLPRSFPDMLDTCGTGGDGHHTLNVSTLSAIVASACGARVAKHGNRSISSVCGSADLLEMLGVKIDLSPEALVECLEKTRFGFFFAPRYHPAVKAAMPARKRIKGKTFFNILGPLSNPAGASFQVVGVYEKRLVHLVAHALAKLGTTRALVVHGKDGMDEISLCGETWVAEVRDGQVLDYEICPEDFGLKREPLENLRCESAEKSKEAALRILAGDMNAGAKIVSLNAAAALYVCGISKSIKEGVLTVMDAIHGGLAEKKLKSIATLTQKLT